MYNIEGVYELVDKCLGELEVVMNREHLNGISSDNAYWVSAQQIAQLYACISGCRGLIKEMEPLYKTMKDSEFW